jgi:hypothetical protein
MCDSAFARSSRRTRLGAQGGRAGWFVLAAVAAMPMAARAGDASAAGLVGAPIALSDYRWSTASGSASLSGVATLRTVAGGAHTCAGLSVALVPSGNPTDAYIATAFGARDSAFHDASAPLPIPPAGLRDIDRRATCDAQGRFSFNALPAGAYYVIAPALWIDAAMVGPNQAPVVLGGLIMQKVSLKEGEARSIALTRQPVEAVAQTR